MSDRERKLSENEAAFRAFNEGLQVVEERVGGSTTMAVVCECSDTHCDTRIELALEAYEEIRSDPTCFVIKIGHDVAALEEVIRQTDTYAVIQKRRGTPAEVACRQYAR